MAGPSGMRKAVITAVSEEAISAEKGEEGKAKRVYFTQMPIGEARADNKRADAVAFYLDLQDRKGTCLIYSSFHHCAVRSGDRQETHLTSSC